jgi:hypothetical protein
MFPTLILSISLQITELEDCLLVLGHRGVYRPRIEFLLFCTSRSIYRRLLPTIICLIVFYTFHPKILIILTLTALSLGFNYIGFISNSYSKVFQALTVVSIVFILACDVISSEYHALSRGSNGWRPQLVVRGLGVSVTSSRPTSADFGPGEILSSHRNYGKSCILRRCSRV